MRGLTIEKELKHIVGWTIALLLLVTPSLTLAGDLCYPSVVKAAKDGGWSVEINISNTANPNFENLETVNTTVGAAQVIDLGGGKWKVKLAGQLINPRKKGRITFRADPEGLFSEGEIVIRSKYPIPSLTQYGLIILAILVVGSGIWLMLRKRRVMRA